MADVRRMLGRLAAKVGRWPSDDSPPSTDPTRLTPADIQAALGMTHSRVGQGIVLARYAGDRSMLLEVHATALEWALFLAEERGWHAGRSSVQETLDRMVLLAIEELVEPQLCRTCHGRAQFFVKKRLVVEDCTVCHGSGIRPRSDRARARFIGVDYRAWRRRWRARYALISSPLSQATGTTLSRLRAKL